MQVIRGTDTPTSLTPSQREARKRGWKFGAWVMERLRGAATPQDVPEPVGRTTDSRYATSLERPACPFYGFIGFPGVMMDNQGNACALTMEHRPCAMEMADETPCWDKCTSWNHGGNKENVRQFLATAQVFPNELHPKGASSWEGINGLGWFRHRMGRQYP